MKLYKVTDNVIDCYRETTRGNLNTSDELIAKKLTRNILLANKLPEIINRQFIMYQYGNLLILTRKNTIVWIHNIKGDTNFYIDEYQYRKLNKILDIQ